MIAGQLIAHANKSWWQLLTHNPSSGKASQSKFKLFYNKQSTELPELSHQTSINLTSATAPNPNHPQISMLPPICSTCNFHRPKSTILFDWNPYTSQRRHFPPPRTSKAPPKRIKNRIFLPWGGPGVQTQVSGQAPRQQGSRNGAAWRPPLATAPRPRFRRGAGSGSQRRTGAARRRACPGGSEAGPEERSRSTPPPLATPATLPSPAAAAAPPPRSASTPLLPPWNTATSCRATWGYQSGRMETGRWREGKAGGRRQPEEEVVVGLRAAPVYVVFLWARDPSGIGYWW